MNKNRIEKKIFIDLRDKLLHSNEDFTRFEINLIVEMVDRQLLLIDKIENNGK